MTERILQAMALHGPFLRQPHLKRNGTADVLLMKAIGYRKGLDNFRVHLRRLRRQKLIHGDLAERIAIGPDPAPVIPKPKLARPILEIEPDPGPLSQRVVDALKANLPDLQTILALDDRGLTFGKVLDLRIEATFDQRPSDERLSPRAVSGIMHLWFAGVERFEDIAELLAIGSLEVRNLLDGSPFVQERSIVAIHAQGETAAAIAKRAGVSREKVETVLLSIGLHPRSLRRLPGPTAIRAQALLQKGLSIREIAGALETTQSHVRRSVHWFPGSLVHDPATMPADQTIEVDCWW